MNDKDFHTRLFKTVKRVRVLAGLLTAATLLLAWLVFFSKTTPANPFDPPEMTAARYASHDVVGDLGGMPVTIPSHFANFVEYNGDSGWGEKRKGPRPERTHASKLSSFGFYVRFPDMAGLSNPELWKDKESRSIYNTMWIDVGLNSGDRYTDAGGLDRLTSAIGKSGAIIKYEQYAQLPDLHHGLTVYAAAGIDPKTKKPYRQDSHAKDIFVHRDPTGRVDAYISCSNRPHEAAPCKQYISLEPNMKALAYVGYRRGQLPEWQRIQTSVTQLILSFNAAKPATTEKPVASKP